ncbi:neutral zinc metallopeptidase [Actinomadura gamaensis]|uniref:Neutral zinc metallopeptidase n=1 Tax=Actinomadura gamaensis TaxID=1763541 RepID=A0ABV9TTD5_9ACTN
MVPSPGILEAAMHLPHWSPIPAHLPVGGRSLAILALGATLATGGALAVPSAASAFTATPGEAPVAPSAGSLMPGTPTGDFPVSSSPPSVQATFGSVEETPGVRPPQRPGAAKAPATGQNADRGSGPSGRDAATGPAADRPSATARTMDRPRTDAFDDTTFQKDLQDAQDVVDGFWRRHWTAAFGGRYDPPGVLGPYDGAHPATAPRCGDRRLEQDNAAYCPDGDYLAWDEHLMRGGYGRGDAWVYMVIAHEWGHAVQHRMPAALVSDRTELQADCLAGAALHGAARDGELRFDRGDAEEIVAAFQRIGDGAPWTRSGDHGTAAQRIAQFTAGGTGGVRACLP